MRAGTTSLFLKAHYFRRTMYVESGRVLSARRLGRNWHCPAVIAGGGAGAADFLGHGVDREALDAGGQLQRLDQLRVEKEVEKADMADAVVVDVLDGHRGAVDHHLAEVVARMLQGEGFLGHLLRVRNHPCRLDVDALVAAIDGLLHSAFDFMGLYKKRRVALCQNVITEIRRQDSFFLYLSSKKRVRGFGSDGKKAFKEAA